MYLLRLNLSRSGGVMYSLSCDPVELSVKRLVSSHFPPLLLDVLSGGSAAESRMLSETRRTIYVASWSCQLAGRSENWSRGK